MKAGTRNRAAHLYALALVAHIDGGDTKEEAAVVARAAYEAREALAAEGYTPADLVTLRQCIAAAKAEQAR